MPCSRPNAHERRKMAARAAALSQSHSNENGSGPSTVQQQPLPDHVTPKPSTQDEANATAKEAAKVETPEPVIMDRDVENVAQPATESDLDAIDVEKDGPITMLRLSKDIAVLTEHSRKLTRENSVLRRKLEKEVKASAENSRQFKQELNFYFLGLRLLAKRLSQDPDEASTSEHNLGDPRVG